MAVLPADQRDLFLPLIDGIGESPPWTTFLRNLVARTNARRAFLMIATDDQPVLIHASAPRAAQEDPLDFERLDALHLHPDGALRPGRIYDLDEMVDYGDPAQLARQRTTLDAMGVRYGRWLRVCAGDNAEAMLVLVREREDFGGAAVALLGAVAAHMTATLGMLATLRHQRLQTAMACATLARLGVGQIALNTAAHVIAADDLALITLPFLQEPGQRATRRLNLRPDVARRLEALCGSLSGTAPAVPELLRIDEARAIDLLLRRSDTGPEIIGSLRTGRREPARPAIRILARLHGLSDNEAALAHALSQGESLAEAGQRLRLTPETARNYSKRIYAKTGTRGQADLVRLVLTGLAVLA
ncbi:LuxR family transcriptional regulator [Novosphingobium sp.]|uniref:helix-turn-helix transcriptional regulator n=1 Tax=Novosphingobium sp. TaxID=1874826 RepID=UPI003341719E